MSGKGFDTRKLMTGKDGKLYITVDGESIWFASVEEFSVGMNVSNVDFHPAGDVQTYGVPDSVKFTASFTEAVVRDDLTIVPILDAIKSGKFPIFSLQGGATEPLEGGESKFFWMNVFLTEIQIFWMLNLERLLRDRCSSLLTVYQTALNH